jgi:hypothetical protein
MICTTTAAPRKQQSHDNVPSNFYHNSSMVREALELLLILAICTCLPQALLESTCLTREPLTSSSPGWWTSLRG